MVTKFLVGLMLFAALPATSTYKLNSYGFGSGGTAGSSTATYSLEGASGDLSGSPSSTTTYTSKPGVIQAGQAEVPLVSAFDNNGGEYYNKLHITVNPKSNPTDTKYLISISTDNFVSNVTYLLPDGTLTSTLTTTAYQTYTALGGSSGTVIIGLVPGTNYYARARAAQGSYSESSYSPTVGPVATASPSLTFSLVTSTQASPPFSVDFGSLTAGSIATSSNTIDLSLSTNGTTGGDIYVVAQNGALLSSSTGGRIDSVTTDLSSSPNGFGAQNSSITQSSGGPFSVVSPFGATGTNVANITTSAKSLYTSTNPITNGVGKLRLKAKASNNDVAATDYREVLTFIAAGNF
jgi:hypothetical protein